MPTDPIQARKEALRDRIKSRLKSMDRGDLAARSRQMNERIAREPEFAGARCVMLYAALPDEPSVARLDEICRETGKTVAYPRTVWGGERRLEAYEIKTVDRDLILQRLGLREPGPGCASVPTSAIDFVAVPGLAFDAAGGRLGRGGGFYDRFLSDPSLRAVTCGCTFQEFLEAEAPTFPHDRRVAMIATESAVLRAT